MISVCMATYNGEKYLKEQLTSVLVQLGKNDEIIIVDDFSIDKTISVINSLNDRRINIIKNKFNIGPIKSFEKALRNAKGDIIFLSDQDDIWLPNKVTKVLTDFKNSDACVVVHDAKVTDKELNVTCNSWNVKNNNKFGGGWIKTLIKNSYTGANMAMRRKVLMECLPFPSNIPMHDWWIAITCKKRHLKIFVDNDPLILYRRHEGNVTGKKHQLKKMIKNRVQLLNAVRR